MFYSAAHLPPWVDVFLTLVTVAAMIETGRRTIWTWVKGVYHALRSLDRTARTLGDVADGWPSVRLAIQRTEDASSQHASALADVVAAQRTQGTRLDALSARLEGRVLCPLTNTIPDPVSLVRVEVTPRKDVKQPCKGAQQAE